jgi:hypothetical protein
MLLPFKILFESQNVVNTLLRAQSSPQSFTLSNGTHIDIDEASANIIIYYLQTLSNEEKIDYLEKLINNERDFLKGLEQASHVIGEARKPLSPSQRKKKALIFRKSKHKRLRTIEKNKNKMPTSDALDKRANKSARKLVIKKKKILSPEEIKLMTSGNLSIAQKNRLEVKLAKHSGLIKKLVPKMLKNVRAAARAKLTGN